MTVSSSKPDPGSSRRAQLEQLKRQSQEHLDMIEEALRRTRPLIEGERKLDEPASLAPDGGAQARRPNDDSPLSGPTA